MPVSELHGWGVGWTRLGWGQATAPPSAPSCTAQFPVQCTGSRRVTHVYILYNTYDIHTATRRLPATAVDRRDTIGCTHAQYDASLHRTVLGPYAVPAARVSSPSTRPAAAVIHDRTAHKSAGVCLFSASEAAASPHRVNPTATQTHHPSAVQGPSARSCPSLGRPRR